MSVTGVDELRERLKRKLRDVSGDVTERGVTALLITGAQYAFELTPVDSSTLINSQFKKTWQTDMGWSGAVYYEAPYALPVHEAPGTLKGLPRSHFGKTADGVEFGGGTGQGNYWDPDAEPQFLKKGMELMAHDALPILRSIYESAAS